MSTPDSVATPIPEDTPDTVVEESETRGRGAGIAVFAALVVAAVGVVGFALAPRGTSSTTTIGDAAIAADPIGAVAPDFTAAKVGGGGTVTLSELRGKPVVLNFWASWCGTCKDEAATLAAAEKAWRSKGVVFVGVDERDTADGAAGFQKEYGIDFQSVDDADARIQSRYRVTGLPETFFIGPDGTVTAKYISAIDRASIDKLITEQLAAGKSAT